MKPIRKLKPRWHQSRRVAVALFVFAAVWVVGMLTGVIPDAINYVLGIDPVTGRWIR